MTDQQLAEVLGWLEQHADPVVREQLSARYGIHAARALGIPMKDLKALAKRLGPDRSLAAGLWASGGYEARTVASLIDVPAEVTVAQMDAWVGDFDNWAICDTVCFNLFDRAPGAWGRIEPWAADDREFVRRAAFALVWALALHDRSAPDDRFLVALRVLEDGAGDPWPLVSKAVVMALRAIGKKRAGLVDATREVGERLVSSADPAAARVGRAVLRELPG